MASHIEMVAAYERYCEESGRQPSSESRRAFYQAWAIRKVAELEKQQPGAIATQTVRESWHGTQGGYSNHFCRCNDCRRAHAEALNRRRRQRWNGPIPSSVKHGTPNTYCNWGCRCQPYLDARAAYESSRRRRARLKAAS